MHKPDQPSDDTEFPEPQPIESSPSLKPKKAHWFKRHKKLAIILGVAIVLLLAGGSALVYSLTRPKAVTPAPVQTTKPAAVVTPPPVYYSELTGAKVDTQVAETAPVTAIMIENSPDARPQSGLKNSGVVYEAIAEGGITRFMVLYQSEKPQTIGPVRSVRIYDVNLLRPYDASLAHVGGSAEALAEVRNGTYRDLDQFFNSSYYHRTSDRPAPHNVYTSFDSLDKLNAAKGYTSSNFTGLARKDSTAASTPTATSIKVTISSALYNSSYTYNATTNTYDRSQAGKPHLDREDGQISPRVVIVMKVAEQTVLKDGYREDVTTTGQGEAHIFQDGTEIDATWHRATNNDQLTFTDTNGDAVALARGQTWITAVPASTGGVTWQ